MLNYRELLEEATSLVVWLAVIFPESGASGPPFLSLNLTVLKHPCASGAKQKPNAANAKLINTTPAAWAWDRQTMPRRTYSLRVYCDDALVSMGRALIGPLICFVNFVYKAAAFQKVLWLISVSAPEDSMCCRNEGKLVFHSTPSFINNFTSDKI